MGTESKRYRDEYIKHIHKFSERGATIEEAEQDFIASQEEPKLPPTPTNTMPGSVQRLMVYAARAAAGQAIYHPNDSDFMGRNARKMQRVTYSGHNNVRKVGVSRKSGQ